MGRLTVEAAARADARTGEFVEAFARRVEAMPPGQCPVGLMLGQLQASAAQTCGKCTPCAQGMPKLEALLREVAQFRATAATLDEVRVAATLLRDTADCAVGWQAGAMVLAGLDAFADEFASHVEVGMCAPGTRQTVPCVTLCPAHVNVPAYIALAEEGRLAEAVKMIRKDNPFPTACALVCEHPCEERCRRTMVDAPVNIRGIKKYIVDTVAADTVETPAPLAPTGKRVAVVGAGPSGLTCAYFLGLMGHSVTVFERRSRLGGMMRYGIPAYRLPRERLDEDIRAVLGAGDIEVRTGCDIQTDKMRSLVDEFDAVYVAVGAQGGKTLPIEGADAAGVMSAVDVLEAIGDEQYPDFTGKNVVVIGGGNVAMDCARTAVRLGAEEVTVVYRRTEDEMPAGREEIAEAREEGIRLETLAAPVEILEQDGAVCGLRLDRMVQGDFGRDGRRRVRAVPNGQFVLPCDGIVTAVNQELDDAFLKVAEDGSVPSLEVNRFTSQTSREGLFVGGDASPWGANVVIQAIADGKRAAASIDRYLGGSGELNKGEEIDLPAIPDEEVEEHPRFPTRVLPVEQRCDNFDEVACGFHRLDAMAESLRCLHCDRR